MMESGNVKIDCYVAYLESAYVKGHKEHLKLFNTYAKAHSYLSNAMRMKNGARYRRIMGVDYGALTETKYYIDTMLSNDGDCSFGHVYEKRIFRIPLPKGMKGTFESPQFGVIDKIQLVINP